jgi:type IV pilus assembly protein PilA
MVQCYYRTFTATGQTTDWNAGTLSVRTIHIHPRGYNKMKNQKGFTLIELMIVVAIIAILAAIAISQYQDYVIRSQVSEGSSLADGVKTAVGEFVNNRGYYPISNQSAGLAAAGSITGEYVGAVVVSGGVITASYSGAKANTSLKTNPGVRHLAFSPITHAGSIEWHCKSSATAPAQVNPLKQKWCPSSCVCTG